MPNAVDADAYLPYEPRALGPAAGPVVLYVGTLHRDRLDVDLCVTLASGLAWHGRPSSWSVPWPWTPPGPDPAADAGCCPAWSHASTRPSPRTCKNADVLVVPHVVTDFTDSLDPIKVYEYLAAALPVVSTPVAGFREIDLAHVSVVPGSGVLAATLEFLSSPPKAAGASPAVPSWTDRADAIRAVMDEVARR